MVYAEVTGLCKHGSEPYMYVFVNCNGLSQPASQEEYATRSSFLISNVPGNSELIVFRYETVFRLVFVDKKFPFLQPSLPSHFESILLDPFPCPFHQFLVLNIFLLVQYMKEQHTSGYEHFVHHFPCEE